MVLRSCQNLNQNLAGGRCEQNSGNSVPVVQVAVRGWPLYCTRTCVNTAPNDIKHEGMRRAAVGHSSLVKQSPRFRDLTEPFAFASCTGSKILQAIKSEYGETSAKGALAFKALDAALAESFDIMSTGAGRRLTSQLVAGPALAETLAVGGRRLGTLCWVFLCLCSCVALFVMTSDSVGVLSTLGR